MTNLAHDAEDIRFGNVREVANITGLSKSTLDKMRLYRPDESPPFLQIGRRVVYPLTGSRGLSAWINKRIVGMQGAVR